MTTAELTAVHDEVTQHPRRDLRDGALAMAPLAAGYAAFAMAIGVAARASRDPLAGWGGSLLIFGGSAQLLVLDLVGSGAGLWAVVVAAVVIQARLLVFSATLAPLWRGAPVVQRMAAAAVITDPLWALVSRRPTALGSARSHRLYYAGAGTMLLVIWTLATAVGVLVGGSTRGAGAASTAFVSVLGMCVPACLAVVVGASLRTSSGTRSVVAAVVVGWLTRGWPDGSGLLVAMAAAALAGTGVRSRRSRR